MKTFIRRPGNKTRHLKHIIPLIPKFSGTYIEPFLGTGAVYLHLLPPKAILNDLNKDIIDIWKLVKSDPEYIIKEIDKFKQVFLPMNNTNKLIFCKDILKKMDTYKGKRRTIMYLLMIYCSFKGTVYLTNRFYISSLNLHIYKNESCHIFTEKYKSKMIELQKILKNTRLESIDYKKIIQKAKKGDFVFLDPPYEESKKYSFNYNKNENFDNLELKLELDKLTKIGVKWMMTQIDTKQVRHLFKEYKFYQYTNNANFNNSDTKKKEVIIINY